MSDSTLLLYLLGVWAMYEEYLRLAHKQNISYPKTCAFLAALTWPAIIAWDSGAEAFEALTHWKNKS